MPEGPDVQYCNEKPWDELVIKVYPGANGSFTLYEDEGDGQNYRKGEYSTIEFTLKGRTLSIGERSGSFKGMSQKRVFKLVFADGAASKEVEYSGDKMSINF